MFESDQHEFDEEYAEVSHPAPPSPPKPPATTPATAAAPTTAATAPTPVTARTTEAAVSATVATTPTTSVTTPVTAEAASPMATATPAAVHEPIVEEPEEEQPAAPESEDQEQEEFVDAAEKPVVEAPPKKKPNLLLIGGFAALVIFGLFVVLSTRPKSTGPPPGDLGPGIVAVAGLRGHLDTVWEGNGKTGKLVYKLRIEPMEDRWGAGFSRATSHAPMPMSVNIRLLDTSGFALCGKEIDFRFDPQNAQVPVSVSPVGANGKKLPVAELNAAIEAARQSVIARMQAAEVTREQGKDIFQNQTTNDGQVTAVNVQGTLPCSPDQYRRTDYWDFNTNFPTLDQQAALLDPNAGQHAKEFEPPAHPGKRTLAKPQGGFVIQGDDRVTGYDSARGVLTAEQKTFEIDKRFGQVTATEWASHYTLIHYRCDQQANCALSSAGNAAVLHARLD
jgi:hypothetical protein